MIAGWDRSVVAWKERLNSGGAAMVIRDIPAVPTGSYVELYGTLTCYLVFLYDFPFRKIMRLRTSVLRHEIRISPASPSAQVLYDKQQLR